MGHFPQQEALHLPVQVSLYEHCFGEKINKSAKIQGRDAEQAQGGEEGHGGGETKVSVTSEYNNDT